MVWDQLIYREPKTRIQAAVGQKLESFVTDGVAFELRQGVKFHNGEAFDADDVVYTLNYLRSKNGVKVQRNVN